MSWRRTVIKLIYCFKKRHDLADDEFDAYWARVHGPIAARIPGLRRLVQVRALKLSGDERGPDFDGVAELWFDDADALLRARASQEWRQSGLDEPNFIDPESARYMVGVERPVIET